jgi:hypothetical protein
MKETHLCAFPGRAGSAYDVINHERCECMVIVQSRGSLIACRAEACQCQSSTLPVFRFHVIYRYVACHVLYGQSRVVGTTQSRFTSFLSVSSARVISSCPALHKSHSLSPLRQVTLHISSSRQTRTLFPLELSSVSLGGSVISVSDDFFADVSQLLRTEVGSPHVPFARTDLAFLPRTAREEPERAIWP